jgi:peptide deformylase
MSDDLTINRIGKRLSLRVYPDPFLRRTALPVVDLCESVRALLRGMARVIQHEIDHLNGLLILDYGPMENLSERERVLQELQHARKSRL